MNKDAFLYKLEELLTDLPESEKKEALEYYRNYFEDAGEDKTDKVIEELGSPEHISEIIHRDLSDGKKPDYDSSSCTVKGKNPADKKLVVGIAIVAAALAVIAAACFILGSGRSGLFGQESLSVPESGSGISVEATEGPVNTPTEGTPSGEAPDEVPAAEKLKPEPKADGPKEKPEPDRPKPEPKADGPKEKPEPEKPKPEPKADGPKEKPEPEKPKPGPKAGGPKKGID